MKYNTLNTMKTLKKIIRKRLRLFVRISEIENQNLIKKYDINSIVGYEIFFMIESKFKIAFEDDEMLATNLDNLNSLCDMILVKLNKKNSMD